MREEYEDGKCKAGGGWLGGLGNAKDVWCGRGISLSDAKTHGYGRVFRVALLSLALCGAGAFLSLPARAQTLPAFPGAEGGGAISVGGRGGIVYEVTNLNDSGPGSLRAGIEMTVPRTIVFRVAGNIQLSDRIVISPTRGNLTIAGQTAPGGGIVISGKQNSSNLFQLQADNIIIRNLRFRHGRWNGCNENCDNGFGINILINNGNNVIFDHCSFSWAHRRLFTINGGPSSRITVSNSVLGELLNSYDSSGVPFHGGEDFGVTADQITDIDMHRNLISTASHRFPLIKIKSTRIVNNIIYNWRAFATQTGGGATVDIISNKYLRGPLYGQDITPWVYDIGISQAGDNVSPTGPPSIYVQGNIGYHNADPNSDSWALVRQLRAVQAGEIGPLEEQYRRSIPMPSLMYPISSIPSDQLDSFLLPLVGASRRLDCMGNWVFNRDPVDTRVISEYQNGTGFMPEDESEVGGFPVLAPGTPCADTDSDGIPNQWEIAKGLNPNNASDGPTLHTSGYSNLERYLNGESATTASCNTVTTSNFSQATYASYGAPFDVFAGNAPLVDATCTSSDIRTIAATIGTVGDTTRIAYTKGYYYDPGTSNWAQFTGTCTGLINGEWCAGPVTATITDPDISTASAGAPTYFVGMTCSVQGGSWKCGCRDTTCSNFLWQIQGAGL